jgi:hypothetical protein
LKSLDRDPIYVAEEDDLEETLEMIAESPIPLGNAGDAGLHWERKPLGTVRMSLGWMSTFEDVYKFATFMESSYKDCGDKLPEEYLRSPQVGGDRKS